MTMTNNLAIQQPPPPLGLDHSLLTGSRQIDVTRLVTGVGSVQLMPKCGIKNNYFSVRILVLK